MSRPPRWSDDDLRRAVARARSFAEVKRFLGLSSSGGNHYLLRERIRVLALDLSHFTRDSQAGKRPWTESSFREAVTRSRTYPEIIVALGFEVSSALYNLVHRDIRRLSLSREHLQRARNVRTRRWTDDELRAAVRMERSYAGVLRKLGLVAAGGNYDSVRSAIRQLGLDTSHFRGQAWNRGGVKRPRMAAIPLEEVLVAGRSTSSHMLKRRLIRAGIKLAKCELCGWAERAPDGRLPLELDHINGNRADNRLENLRVLCPNCHALQPTHRGLNQARRRS